MSEYRQLDQSDPIARKPHRCIWCGEMIESGEKYRREKGVYEGEVQNQAWHMECVEDRYSAMLDSYDNEFIPYSGERPRKEKPHV